MILDSPIITGSLIQQAGQTAEIPRYTAVSSSFLAASASINQRLNDLSTDSGSQALRLNSLEAKSASVDTTLSGLNTFTQSFSSSVATSISASNANISALSASVSTVTGDFSSSVATSFSASAASTAVLSASIDTRLDVIESSFATTGSNTFKGTQIVSGSLYVTQDLIVQGSSSLQNITGSSVNIGTNRVILNTDTPAVRFGGISVQDSGSTGETGSLWWDSINNHWIYENPVGETYNSAILIAGPKNTGSLGEETGLTSGYIPVASGEDHISDSIVTQTGGNKITINGTLEVTGHISASNGVVSSSAQLTSSYDSRYVLSGSITQTTWDNIANKPGGIVSGSEQTTSSLDLRYRQVGTPITFAELDSKPTLVSGSSQFVTLTDPFTGSFTGSFKGDGSLLSGLTGGGKIHTQSTAAATWVFNHNLNVQYPNVTVYNSIGQIVLPQSITANNSNTLTLEFGTNVAGYAVAGIGGIIEVQGRTVKQQFTASVSWRFEHNLGDRFVNVQVYDQNYEKVIPENIVLTDTTSSLITFPSASAGWAIGTMGGDLPAISSSYAGYTLQVSNGAPYTASWVAIPNVTVTNAISASYIDYTNVVNKPTLISGSSQIDIISTTNYSTFSSSLASTNLEQGNRLNSLENASGSYAISSSVASVDAGQNSRLNSLENASGSYAISSSVASVDAGQNDRLNSIEAATGSYSKLSGGNTFTGTQVFTGSVYITSDLIVQGSSSLQNITASAVSIGTNIVILNTDNPAVRYAGISVIDSGSTGLTGSILWDSSNNNWLYQNPSGAAYASAKFISGPQSATLGSEPGLVTNFIQKAVGDDHISSSAIYDDGSNIKLLSNTEVSGTFRQTASTASFAGRVGVGYTSPTVTMQVSGTIAVGADTTGWGRILFDTDVVKIQGSKNGTDPIGIAFWTQASGGGFSEAVRISSEGRVGIGITNPTTSSLELYSTSNNPLVTLKAGHIGAGAGIQFDARGLAGGNTYQVMSSGTGNASIGGGKFALYQPGFATDVDGYYMVATGSFVGIGTTNPASKFHVNKNSGSVTGNIEIARFYSNDLASGYYSYISVGKDNATSQGISAGFTYSSTAANGYGWLTVSGDDPTIGTGLIVRKGGRIGIGITNPTYNVEVVTSSTDTTTIRVKNISNSGSARLILNPEGAGAGSIGDASIFFDVNAAAWVAGVDKSDSSKFKISYDPYGDFRGGNHFTITTSGLVGIGTTNPSNAFEVVNDQAATTTVLIRNVNDQANAASELRFYGNTGIAPLKNNQQISLVRGSGGVDWALGTPANSDDFVISGGTNQGDGKPSLGTSERLRITSGGTVQPGANGTQDLGTSALRWSTIYTSDLSLSNGIGDYTIVEGEEDLFLYNNKKNKVYKFALIEVNPSEATPKKS